MIKERRSKKEVVRDFTEYGFHLWIVFFLANILLVYTFNLFTHAANPEGSKVIVGIDPEEEVVPTRVEPTPAGPIINLTFAIPGIGTQSGNLNPIHPVRDITIYLYASDVNVRETKIKPLYTIQSKVTFDSDPRSPTYTKYVNTAIPLGASIVEGNYQILFRTEQSFRTLVKEEPGALGGQIFTLYEGEIGEIIPPQPIIMGDIAPPKGNNNMDIADFNILLSCYGDKKDTSSCPSRFIADLNDDGSVDGIDYNLMILGFAQLIKQGFPAPVISLPPVFPTHVDQLSDLASPTPKSEKDKISPTPTPASSFSGGAMLGGLLFFLLVAIVGGIGYYLYKTKPEFKELLHKLINMTPFGNAVMPEAKDSIPADASPAVESTGEENTAKSYFIKKQADDDTGKGGVWLTLTDDNGPTLGYYKGTDAVEGFAKVKGEMKTEDGKTFMEISEITPEA